MKTLSRRSLWATSVVLGSLVVGIGGVELVAASPSGSDPVVHTISPCILADTRPGSDNVGPKNTPMNPSGAFNFQVTGTNGECTIPANAFAVVTNVTILNNTQDTFLTLWPTGLPRPDARSISAEGGAGPTSNQVTSDLSATGQLRVFNRFGTTDLQIAIVGYMTDHHHDDEYLGISGGTLSGSLTVDGTLTADDIQLSQPKTQVMAIPESAFVPRYGSDDYFLMLGTGGIHLLNSTSNFEGLAAPVILPNGARITNVTARLYDASTSEDIDVVLFRHTTTGGGYLNLGSVSSSGNLGATSPSFAVNHVVDNVGGAYQIRVVDAVNSDLRVFSIEITYEIDEI